MYGQDVFDVQTLLGFPTRILATYFAFFPPVSFLLHSFLVQFSYRVCLSFKVPFSVLHSLVSFSCSCFFSHSSMVNYSSVRSNCPSIAFLFTRLGCLLKFVEEGCLDWVSLFVREDYPYEAVLSLLFPLISHFAKVARSLKMSEVRFSDLETGLSSFDDLVILGATYLSTSYKSLEHLVFPYRKRRAADRG